MPSLNPIMQKLFQAFAVYLEKETQLHKNDLLRRMKAEDGTNQEKSKLIRFLTALNFHHMFKDASGQVSVV